MTTLILAIDSHNAPSTETGRGQQATSVEALPSYGIDMEERRWQLEWERRNVED